MQTIKEKMIPAFRDANGGLFQAVEKADVGSAYLIMTEDVICERLCVSNAKREDNRNDQT